MRHLTITTVTLIMMVLSYSANAQDNPYELPDPLKMEDGRTVRTKRQWIKERRPELMEMLRSQMFGREPGQAPDISLSSRKAPRPLVDWPPGNR